jgi:hypothetical protein
MPMRSGVNDTEAVGDRSPGVSKGDTFEMSEYIVADLDGGSGWNHIWVEHSDAQGAMEIERACRFVLDRELMTFLHLEIFKEGHFVPATPSEAADLFDSVVHGNPWCLDDPDAYGLCLQDRLPPWCACDRTEPT